MWSITLGFEKKGVNEIEFLFIFKNCIDLKEKIVLV